LLTTRNLFTQKLLTTFDYSKLDQIKANIRINCLRPKLITTEKAEYDKKTACKQLLTTQNWTQIKANTDKNRQECVKTNYATKYTKYNAIIFGRLTGPRK
jgi:hypothetical protein